MSSLGINLFNVPDAVDAAMKYQYSRLYGMQSKLKAEDTQITAYNALKTLFSNFQGSLTNIGNSFNTVAYQATSSDTSILNASVTGNDVGVGSHNISVTSIAKAQGFISNAVFTTKTAGLGVNETLSFTNSADSSINYSVAIASTDSLENIRDKINNSSANIGVTAQIVASTGSSGTQYNLILSAETGLANQITISGDTGNNFQFSQTNSASDAIFTFDGLPEQSSSNVIDDVLDGLTFTLTNSGSATISTSLNGTDVKGGVQKAIQNMLNAYNQIITFLDGNQFVTDTETTSDNREFSTTVINDAFSTIKSQLSNVMNSIFQGTGDINSLYDLGIDLSPSQTVFDQYDTNRSVSSIGSLQIDSTINVTTDNMSTFAWNLTNDYGALVEYFTAPTTGLIDSLNDVIQNSILAPGDTGIISGATNNIISQETAASNQISTEQDRLSAMRANFITQYSRLNATISKYQGLSDYLEKQYSYLAGMYKK